MSVALGVLQTLLMIGGPLAAAALFRRRERLPWGLFGWGALAFVASQLVHLPILWLLSGHAPPGLALQCAVLGLLAGLCEEPARYLVYRRWLPKASSYAEGVMVGLGHGGIESIIVGALVLLGLMGSLTVSADDPATTRLAAQATLEAAPLVRALAVWERVVAITFHVGLSLLVLAAARRRALPLLGLAVLLHSATDALVVFAHVKRGIEGAELAALPFGVLGVFIILFARRRDLLERTARDGVVDFTGAQPATGMAISSRALTKEFDARTAVDALTLDVAKGQVLALLGPNGAGKTTTVRMLCALIPPTRGAARVAGSLLVSEEEALRARVGILTETPGLYERLTAYENLELFARLYGLDEKTRRERIERHLRAFDIWERRDDRVSGFSKGMKQKLAIVRSLLHEPEVLFLDEPSSGLDPVASREVQDMVLALKRQGRTILLTTHRLAEAEELADLVGVMKGKLLVLDAVADLKARMFGKAVVARIANPSDALAEKIGRGEWKDGELTVPLADPVKETPALVRELVAAGAELVSIGEVKHSLEDVYLGLVKEGAPP